MGLLTGCASGSSPPVRGSDAKADIDGSSVRFIPARAGIGHQRCLSQPRQPVHPRPCGDRYGRYSRNDRAGGSSPPVRGSVYESKVLIIDIRFIPARAGIGAKSRPKALIEAVHPRPCGDRTRTADAKGMPYGSSPPVRGSAEFFQLKLMQLRFIPARAGIGSPRARRGWQTSVHPRPCGDRSPARACSTASSGSSPPVRGSVMVDYDVTEALRFIPARAGIG